MIKLNPDGYFITGSDTDVGKTYIACEIIRQLRQHGHKLEIRKPAESGCKPGAGNALIAADASKLEAANDFLQSSQSITPLRYKAALAPHRAAMQEGKTLTLADLITACKRLYPENLFIVEGAGGFYSPLAQDALNADLAQLLKLDVIIVVDDRVGAVNQALLSIQAVQSYHLSVAAVILNRVSMVHEDHMNNAEDLSRHCAYPIFSCGYQQSLESIF